LVQTATLGRNVSVASSWKELISTTAQSSCALRAATSLKGNPMLPQASARMPAALSSAAVSPVVVVLPLVPVTAITGQRQLRKASSISPRRGMPASTGLRASGTTGSIPGLSTAKSKSCAQRNASSPKTTRAPREESLMAVSRRGAGSPESSTVTSAPLSKSKAAAASPLRPRPSTATCRPL